MNEALSISLDELVNTPNKIESLLELLTSEQISVIEQTLCRVKKRRLDAATKKKDRQLSTIPSINKQNESTTEVKDGIEWLTFTYSHNRSLKTYSIRIDLEEVDISLIDDKFKYENCIYPRANLPKDEYQGNRWTYETECNVLGWKLAWLNKNEIAGKKGLIQRAVDSFRNRYPSMRSRRVTRQEKMLNGTLRKRKHQEEDTTTDNTTSCRNPKTMSIRDTNNHRLRIKINVESVNLEEINTEFRQANCPFPRAMNTPKPVVNNTRWLEETMCNELAWKLAWLNPKHLAGKKNMLQRALDIYRSKFMPSLHPRKNSSRTLLPLLNANKPSAQNTSICPVASPSISCASGTTVSLDFADCFSMTDDDEAVSMEINTTETAAICDFLLQDISSYNPTTPSSDTATMDLFNQFITTDPFSTTDMSKFYDSLF